MLSSWRSSCTGISQRWIFAIMAFFALWLCNALRVTLSIAITKMTIPIEEIRNVVDETCASTEKPALRNASIAIDHLYDWDEYTQGIILSSYFWSYAISQFPCGYLSEQYGGKHFLGYGVLVTAVLTFITPLCAEYGDAIALIILRFIMGLTSGTLYPATGTMLARWTAPSERTKIGSIVYAGGMLGIVCGTSISALIIRYAGMGWPGVFYIFGAVGMAWFPIWMLFCYNSPNKHPFISEAELRYLEESSERKQKPPPAPYRHIFTSKESWAFFIALFGLDWNFFTMTTDLPKYMSDVVKFSIEDNGYLSSAPYLSAWLFSTLCFWIVDRIIERKWLKLGTTRKLFTTVALVGPAVFILGASYAECDQVMVVVMFVAGMTLMGAAYPSIFVNTLDLSPNYSGTLMAIANSLAAVAGIISPYIIGILTPNQTVGEWRRVFWIIFTVATLSWMYFLIYGSSEVQPWNDPEFLENDKSKKKTVKKGGNNVAESENVYL